MPENTVRFDILRTLVDLLKGRKITNVHYLSDGASADLHDNGHIYQVVVTGIRRRECSGSSCLMWGDDKCLFGQIKDKDIAECPMLKKYQDFNSLPDNCPIRNEIENK